MAKVKTQKLKEELFLSTYIEDNFLEVKDIKSGDIVYECDVFLGVNYEFKALTDAKFLNGGWSCLLQDKLGKQHELFVSGQTKHIYLPNIYRSPVF